MMSFKEFLDAKAEYIEYSKKYKNAEPAEKEEGDDEYVPCDEPHTHNDEGDCVVKVEGCDKKEESDEIKDKIASYAKV